MYEIIVSNIGTVCETADRAEARRTYNRYVSLSQGESGKAMGEDVTLTENGEPTEEHIGTNQTSEEDMTAEEILQREA